MNLGDCIRERGNDPIGLVEQLQAALGQDWTSTHEPDVGIWRFRHSRGLHFLIHDLAPSVDPQAVAMVVAALSAEVKRGSTGLVAVLHLEKP